MREYIDKISRSKLFKNIKKEDIPVLTDCLGAVVKKYKKGEYIIRWGENVRAVYMVAEGCVHIVKTDHWGNESIMARSVEGAVFAEAYACLENVSAGVDAVAAEDTIVIEMNINSIITTCPSACKFHSVLIRNLIAVIAEKNAALNDKVECVCQRSTRDKIRSYLSLEAEKRESNVFDIPFNRQQMADYLAVERSALSKELSKMRAEGIIAYNKNHFEILE